MSEPRNPSAAQGGVLRAFLVGAFFCIAFAYIATVGVNRLGAFLPSSQISSLAVVFGILLVVAVNPLLRWLRCRPMTRAEVFLVFIMATVPAGLSVFGFISQVLPLSGGLHHPGLNTAQSGWNAHLVPNLREDMFVGSSVFDARHVTDWDAFLTRLTAEGKDADPAATRFFARMPEHSRRYARELLSVHADPAAARAAAVACYAEGLPSVSFTGPDGAMTALSADEAAHLAPSLAEETARFFDQNDLSATEAASALGARLEPLFRGVRVTRGGVSGAPRSVAAELVDLAGKGAAAFERHGVIPSLARRRDIVADGLREALADADLTLPPALAIHLSGDAAPGTEGLDVLIPPTAEILPDGTLPEGWKVYLTSMHARATTPGMHRRLWSFLPDRVRLAVEEGAASGFCPVPEQRVIRGAVLRVLSDWALYFDPVLLATPDTADEASVSYAALLDAAEATPWDNPGKALRQASAGEGTLSSEAFFLDPAFAALDLPPEALGFARRGARHLTQAQVRALNRLALEAAFPGQVPDIRFVLGQEALAGYAYGIGTRGQQAFPVFIKRDDETLSAWLERCARYFSQSPALTESSVRNWREWLRDLAAESPASDAAGAFRRALPAELRARIRAADAALTASESVARSGGVPEDAFTDDARAALVRDTVSAVNGLFARADLFPASVFATRTLRTEPAALFARSDLDESGRVALNRFLLEEAFPDRIIPFRQYFFGEVPWSAWGGAFAFWGTLLGLCALMFYALNELMFRQWYEQEKLVFPLARIAELVLSNEDGGTDVPATFRLPLFWVGFSIAFIVMFYNGLVAAKVIPEMAPINLGGRIDSKLAGTIWEGLNPRFCLHIFFALIGIAFFLPTEILFSVWFFYLFMMGQQLVAVWMGYGQDCRSFPANWVDASNFMTAQGGGALEVFGFLCIWRIRRNLFAFVYRLAGSSGLSGFSRDDIARYTVPSVLFLAALGGFFWFMLDSGISAGMAALTLAMLLFLTTGLVRLVAECGIIGFQMWFGPVHLMKMLGLMAYPAFFAAKGLSMVIVMLAGIFVDLKTFMAPTMMNARYLAEKSAIRRGHFAGALVLSIVLTLLVATATSLALAYDKGASAMDSWFYLNMPQNIFGTAAGIQRNIADFMEFDPANAAWCAVGAVTCAAIVYLRQFLFWVPHPIGLLMFVNPLMHMYWFSFFIAWICKRAAVRYTSTDSYVRVRALFIGLLIGECVAIAIALLLELNGYGRMGLGFNRNYYGE